MYPEWFSVLIFSLTNTWSLQHISSMLFIFESNNIWYTADSIYLLLIAIINKGSMPDSSSQLILRWLLNLTSFFICFVKCIVCDVCGLRSPSFESSNVLYNGAGISSPSYWQQVEEQAPKPVGWMMCFLLMTFVPVQKLCVDIYIYIYIYAFLYEFCYRTYIYIFSLVYQLCFALW